MQYGKRILPANGAKALRDTERAKKLARRVFEFVGADRQAEPFGLQRVHGRQGTWKQGAVIRDMRLVMRDEHAEEFLEARLVDRAARGCIAALDQGSAASTEQNPGLIDRKRRDMVERQHRVKRPHQIARRVGKRSVEVEHNHGQRSHREILDVSRGGCNAARSKRGALKQGRDFTIVFCLIRGPET